MYKLEGDYSWEACVPSGHTHTLAQKLRGIAKPELRLLSGLQWNSNGVAND